MLVRAKQSVTAAHCRHPPYMQLGMCWLQVKCNLPWDNAMQTISCPLLAPK